LHKGICSSYIAYADAYIIFIHCFYSSTYPLIFMNPAFHISHTSREYERILQEHINDKTKPIGSLGTLEHIAKKIGTICNTEHPKLCRPHIVVFAGDHGIADEGVSAYPKDVTWQMVMNFVRGGAAINVFARQHGINLTVVDAGVAYDFPPGTPIVHAKINQGTKNFLHEPAMTNEECTQAIQKGADIVRALHAQGTNIIGFGEMGIGNTSAASAITSALLCLPVEECTGYGSGVDEGRYSKKVALLYAATRMHTPVSPMEILMTFGGFEIAMMCGAFLCAGELGMIILVDGFIATAAFALCATMYTALTDYALYCHESVEQGHKLLLHHLKADPILKMNMRLGEGTGCAVAYPIIESSLKFLSEMATFSSAGIAEKSSNAL
jgi:nicotinate-nucleotide--dimethylbenzimidazole phosphoribosyltransferase